MPLPDFFSHRVQLRLLVLVGLFMMTIFAMNEARNPDNWRWIWAGAEDLSDTTVAQQNAAPDRPPDTRLKPTKQDQRGPADAIRALPFRNVTEVETSNETVHFPGVDADALLAIEDDRPLRAAERKAWFNLWRVLRETDEQTLRANSLGPTGFVQLFKQPEVYRGKLVDVSGTVHSAHWAETSMNDLELDGYFVCWIRPPGGANAPMAVYVIELPPEFPTGEDVRESVMLTGFFFKRMAYLAKDGSRTAPLIQAKTVHWQRATESVAGSKTSLETAGNLWIGLAVAGSLAVAIMLAVWVYWLSIQPRPSHSFTPVSQATPGQIAKLSEVEVMPHTKEMLRRLADNES